jgi:hypothetical protein
LYECRSLDSSVTLNLEEVSFICCLNKQLSLLSLA